MSKNKETFSKNINIKNRVASFEFHFIETFVAGVVLVGTEIKSIRQGKVNMQDAYAFFDEEGELWLKQLNISPYENGTHTNHEAKRERKLLLKKKEIKRLLSKSEEKGLTIVPTRLFVNEKGFAKIEIALARGKKLYDKREDIKKRDSERELQRQEY
ncbi:MAG: SsrA-binding protein SmpB [Cytophagales bacterium]|nr:MAG: SsrA-binding protein SmpB [Cytophagales bacterium]